MTRQRAGLTACAVAVAIWIGTPKVAAEERPPAPVFALAGGLGNALGWLGVQGERYVSDGRFSVFAGVGYAPSLEEPGLPDTSGTVAVAGGGRAFFGGSKHRFFVEGSVSLVAIEQWLDAGGAAHQANRYGPGVQVGYQLLSRKGITLAASAGIGYAVGALSDSTAVLAGLAVGYAWRRR